MITNNDALKRFSGRAKTYAKYRPGYPPELFHFLKMEIGFKPKDKIADVGAGTGIFSELLLKEGYYVMSVEPNVEMRTEANQRLKKYPSFQIIDGRAEATRLKSKSVDGITVAQAFHWFDFQQTQREFRRILKPGCFVALIWNDRRTTQSPFAIEYEKLIQKFSIDYKKVDHKNLTQKEISSFFAPNPLKKSSFYHFQELDFEGFLGRLLSASYVPNTDHPRFPQMATALKKLFEKHEKGEKIKIEYDTKVFAGSLAKP